MSWSLSDGTTTLAFDPQSGDVSFEEPLAVGVFYPLRGLYPTVRQGAYQRGRIDTPPWVLTGAQLTALRSLISGGNAMTLTMDTGDTYTVRLGGSPDIVLEDTPERGTADARYLATVPLVRVA